MRIAVICNSDSLAVPSVNYLLQNGYLCGIGVLERNKKFLMPVLTGLGVPEGMITFFKKDAWIEKKSEWLKLINADAVWVFGFPWKIPTSVLSIPAKGFYNFHFGSFPKYKGADPIFWQLHNREDKAGFVIHEMTEEVDGGAVIWQEDIPIIPGENYGLYSHRMGMVAAGILDKFIIRTNENTVLQSQSNGQSPHFSKPSLSQRSINWKKQSADEIEWLVNACNPVYGGASTKLRGAEIKVLEVSPADVTDAPLAEPGTIVYADALYGLIVACNDKKFLRLTVLSMREGYVSGGKLFSLGVRPGEALHE